jgi:fatty acid desaturase
MAPTPASPTTPPVFSVPDARKLVKDLIAPNPRIYWLDFLASVTLGWAAFLLTLQLPSGSLLQLGSYLITSLALYRAVLFIHELSHRKRGTFEGFRLTWNLLCGFPLMVPAFLYTRVHLDHHSLKNYGTTTDGEYVPFGAQSPIHIVLFLVLIVVLPLLFPLRFLIIAPLSLLHPKLRQLVWERFSSLTIDFLYVRPPQAPWEGNSAWWEELLTFVYAATFAVLLATGILPMEVFWLWYLVVLLVFLLNSLRTLAAHAYRHDGSEPMGLDAQFLDSVDVPGNRFTTGLWAPVGLRYHATHHLNPAMPYHSLGTAYRRLRDELPDNHSFLLATRSGLWDAISRLWRDAAASTRTRS